MHDHMVCLYRIQRDRMLDHRFTEMGMGTATNGKDGFLYMCQYFRTTPDIQPEAEESPRKKQLRAQRMMAQYEPKTRRVKYPYMYQTS